MFSLFFAGWQQDIKLALLAPILCALFRLIFIEIYGTKKSPVGEWRKWYHCFRYGFWWGMLYNSYIYLGALVAISIPGAIFAGYFAVGDTVRLGVGLAYALVLYTAFLGRMIFYYHFHDIYNNTLLLGAKADKKNFHLGAQRVITAVELPGVDGALAEQVLQVRGSLPQVVGLEAVGLGQGGQRVSLHMQGLQFPGNALDGIEALVQLPALSAQLYPGVQQR